jgi:hypothetical protein
MVSGHRAQGVPLDKVNVGGESADFLWKTGNQHAGQRKTNPQFAYRIANRPIDISRSINLCVNIVRIAELCDCLAVKNQAAAITIALLRIDAQILWPTHL